MEPSSKEAISELVGRDENAGMVCNFHFQSEGLE